MHSFNSLPNISSSVLTSSHIKGHDIYKQDVIFGNRRMTVALHYAKDSRVTQAEMASTMAASLGKIVALAKELKLGEEDLDSISFTKDDMHTSFKDKEGPKKVVNLNEQLLTDWPTTSGDRKDTDSIDKKFVVIQEAVSIFKDVFPPDHSVLSSIVLSDAGTVSQLLVDQTEAFKGAYQSANEFLDQMKEVENQKFLTMLGDYEALSEQLAHPLKLDQIQNLKTELRQKSLQLKKYVDEQQQSLFYQSLTPLNELTKGYNAVVKERKELQASDHPDQKTLANLYLVEKDMRSQIEQFNTKMGQRSLTTHPLTIVQSQIIDFGTVVEKKLNLMEQAYSESTKKKTKKILKELNKAPKQETMKENAAKIRSSMNENSINTLVSTDAAKKLHLSMADLKWGKDYLNLSLTAPANWTNVYTTFIKESSAGTMHIGVSTDEPLNIGLKGGVPAGLRGHEDFKDRATNLFKTTTYLISDGSNSPPIVSFRGGQFPTKEAAKEVLIAILKSGATGLHINALLTPTLFTTINLGFKKFIIKEDKNLLAAHKLHIQDALNDLFNANGTDHLDQESVLSLRNTIAISNFGVNEGAVGEMNEGIPGLLKRLGLRIKMGWHTSIGQYTNEAAERLNGSLRTKLTDLNNYIDFRAMSYQDLDALGPMVQVAQEMQKAWGNNDYADARVGNNQFKLPVLWKVMDGLLGVTCYTNCMSGKDRTGKVQDEAQDYSDEIAMNMADHKQKLGDLVDDLQSKTLDNGVWAEHKTFLSAACFLEADIKEIHEGYLKDPTIENLCTLINAKIKDKIKSAHTAIGATVGDVESFNQFMVKKTMPFFPSLRAGLSGISKSEVNRDMPTNLPKLSLTSMYEKTTDPTATKRENTQREAYNRRLNQLGGSLKITQINTSKPGFKVKGGKPLNHFTSGFDRGFVLDRLKSADTASIKAGLSQWVGLSDVDPALAASFIDEMVKISKLPNEKIKLKQWNDVLSKIEKQKMRSLYPTAKVKA